MDLELTGQRVVVTGSTRGIGRVIAEQFLKEGCKVVVNGRDSVAVDATIAEWGAIYGSEKVMAFTGDFSDEATLIALNEKLGEDWQGLDHLVCNIGSGRSVPPLQEDRSEWLRVLDINLLIAAECVRTLSPLLSRVTAGDGQLATIAFINSICGVEALGCPVAYSASKAALNTYSKGISRELAARGIRVNSITPGNIIFPGSTWDDKVSRDPEGVQEMLSAEVPLNRLGKPEEIASVVVFLASKKAAFVTGANWIVDGGQTRSW